MFRFIFLILCFAALSGCERPLGVDLPYEGDKLVLFGVLSPKNVVSLQISKTVPATGSHIFGDGVTNAFVALYEDGIFIENLIHTSKGIYSSQKQYKPKIRKSYHVKITANGFPPVETLPEVIPDTLRSVQYRFDQTITSTLNEDIPTRWLSLTFEDVDENSNFYNLEIVGSYQNKYVAIQTFDVDRPDGIEDLCVSGGNYNNYFIRDVCFQNTRFNMNIGVETIGFLQAEDPNNPSRTNERKCDEITVTLRNITPTYYEYQKSYYEPEGLLQAFSPPIIRYSNVNGGYGILIAGSEQAITFKL